MEGGDEGGDVLVLRTCRADMTSYGGFRWPESGPVECPGWNPAPVCGGGLHGWAWGEGDGQLGNWSDDARWLVVRVDADSIVDLGGKVKFPRGDVVYCGTRLGATEAIKAVRRGAIIGSTNTGGDGSTNTGGDGSTNTGGDGSTNTGGDGSTLIFYWYDGSRRRIAVAYPGEDGIEPGVPYTCVDGDIVPA